MKSTYNICLNEVLKHEGGYSNHPRDPGGATMKGVIQRVYNSYRRNKGQTPRDVRKITVQELRDIYKTRYWQPVYGDLLPSGLDLAVFDYAVNSGPKQAVKDLQRAINLVGDRNLVVDGDMGPATLDGATSYPAESLVSALCARRYSLLKRLKHWATFGKGWTRRVEAVRTAALEMVDYTTYPAEKPAVPASLGAPGDNTEDKAVGLKIGVTSIITALGGGIVNAVNNPFALVFMLALLVVLGFGIYRFARNINFNTVLAE